MARNPPLCQWKKSTENRSFFIDMSPRLCISRQVSLAARQAARAACRRSHADAAIILAPSFISRATGCAATIVGPRRNFFRSVGRNKFSVQPFSKGWQGGGAAPLLAFRRKRNPPMIPKRSGRAAKTSRWDVLAKGNPIKGFPAGRSPAKTHKQNPR